MTVGIYANLDRDIGCVESRRFADLLTARNVDWLVADNATEYFADNLCPLDEIARRSDILTVFGGDGTMLSIASQTICAGVPLLGINMGNLGFLTECEETELETVVDRLVEGRYYIEERMTLSAEYEGGKVTVINEVSLTRQHAEHTIDIGIYVDGRLADVVTGDGVIVCSPTGSTAYAMSSGGAILSPSLNVMQITAICSHSLHSRPIVVSDDSVVTLRADRTKSQAVTLTVDGRHCLKLVEGSSVRVVRGDEVMRLVRLHEDNFYSRLIKKMNNWNNVDRRAAQWQEMKDN